jgi:hypothetical protein
MISPLRLWALVLVVLAVSPGMAAAQLSTANVYPPNGDTNVSPTPTLEIDCVAPGIAAAQYQIDSDATFVSPDYDSAPTINDICSHVAATDLNSLATYFWRARVQDTLGTWSAWSAPTSFTTANAAVLFVNIFQDGTNAYSGTRDADIRGRFADPASRTSSARAAGRSARSTTRSIGPC